MRISADQSSWAAHGVLRRDFRHTRGEPEVPRRRAAKDTLRWCRGRVGRDHRIERYVVSWRTEVVVDPVTGERATVRVPDRRALRCAGCGRTDTRRFPDHVRAAFDPAFARHVAAAQRWCGDGHLFDVVAAPVRSSWSGRLRVGGRKVCVMCGLAPGSADGFVTVAAPKGTRR